MNDSQATQGGLVVRHRIIHTRIRTIDPVVVYGCTRGLAVRITPQLSLELASIHLFIIFIFNFKPLKTIR